MERAFAVCVSFLIDKYGENKEALAGKLDMNSARRLFWKLFPEAMSSTTRERTRLLCAALAGALNPDIDAETKSRVARAIVQLEPSDVILLKRHYDQFKGNQVGGKEIELAHETPSRQALVFSGCLDRNTRELGFAGVRVTGLGRKVLECLAAWTPEGDSEAQGGKSGEDTGARPSTMILKGETAAVPLAW